LLCGGERLTKKLRNRLLFVLFLIANVAVFVFIALGDDQIDQFIPSLRNIKPMWLAICLTCSFLYVVFDGLMIDAAMRPLAKNLSRWYNIKMGLLGKYYNAITPFATGGQPFQMYHYHRKGIPTAISATGLMLKFIVFQFVTTCMCTVGLIIFGSTLYQQSAVIFWCSVGGLIINSVLPLIVIGAAKYSKQLQGFIGWFVRVGAKLRLIKKTEDAFAKLEQTREQLDASVWLIRQRPRIILPMFFYGVAERVCLLLVTYFLYRAFGLHGDSLIKILFLTEMLNIAVAYFPTPGTAGAAEAGYNIVFRHLFGGASSVAVLLWRLLTYYVILVAGFLFVMLDSLRHKRAIEYDTPVEGEAA